MRAALSPLPVANSSPWGLGATEITKTITISTCEFVVVYDPMGCKTDMDFKILPEFLCP